MTLLRSVTSTIRRWRVASSRSHGQVSLSVGPVPNWIVIPQLYHVQTGPLRETRLSKSTVRPEFGRTRVDDKAVAESRQARAGPASTARECRR